MTPLRERLQSELATKVQRHGVVIWDDPDGAYESILGELLPENTTIYRYTGSWFELRHLLEKSLVGQNAPKLIVYVPTKPEDPDPLEELRAVGSRLRVTLPTLLKNTLSGQLTDQRISQLGRQCSTLVEAEAALEGGESSIDARLISVVGDSSAIAIATALIAGAHDDELADQQLTDAARAALMETIGGDYGDLDGQHLRDSVFRHLALVCISAATGTVPEEIAASPPVTTASQRKACNAVLDRLQAEPQYTDEYKRISEQADVSLRLDTLLTWDDSLGDVNVTPALESIALRQGFQLLETDNYKSAVELAEKRLAGSWWAKPSARLGDSNTARWRAVRALGRLGTAVDHPMPELPTLSDVKQWYSTDGWPADSAYRHSELIRLTSGVVLEELDDLFQNARHRYEAWLDKVLHAASSALASPEVPATDLQRSIHTKYVRKSKGRTAYLLVDALRYELAIDLVERLRSVTDDVEIASCVGTPPSITPVGMAAVLPGADTSFHIDLDDNDRLAVSVGGERIAAVKDRVGRLEDAHGTVTDLVLDDVAQCTNKELKKKIGDASLVLVRSTEIDADGESDQLAASWGSFDMILNVLHTAVAKLVHAGISRVVITSDHGFLAVRQLGEDRRIDKPATGDGEQHRRAWIGRGGTASDSTVKVPLSAFGILGDLDIIAPRGLGVFASGGGLQFFHGGLSPQELIVPVITANAIPDGSPEPQYRIGLSVAGDRITTGVVAVSVTMTGDLFTRESRVRVQLTQNKKRIGTVVGGDGFDQPTETIDAGVDTPRVITMQITANLTAGTTATLEVIDAATGVRLESLEVEIATNIFMDDDLD